MDASDGIRSARNMAEAYVAHCPRTQAEVVRRLRRAGYDADTVETVVDELASAGLLNDRAFARDWVESRSRSRKLGSVRLEAELRRKGVETDAISEALAELDGAAQTARALELARAFIGSADIRDPAARRRLAGYLQRRGHSWETIKQVLCDMTENER
jgi:regulatory protein